MNDVPAPDLPASEQSNIGKPPKGRNGFTEPRRPNWSAAEHFQEAEDAAEAIRNMDASHKINRKEAVIHALCLTVRLVEDWRGEHRDEINAYLGKHAPADDGDEVLAIVKCVFHHQGASQWTWHANAIRQALAEQKTADDVGAYFNSTPPTKAAELWTETQHNKRRGRKAGTVEVGITCELPIPYPEKGKEKKFTIRMRKDGKLVILIPKQATNTKPKRSGRTPAERAS